VHTHMKNSDQILHGDQNFTGLTTPPALAKIIGDAHSVSRA